MRSSDGFPICSGTMLSPDKQFQRSMARSGQALNSYPSRKDFPAPSPLFPWVRSAEQPQEEPPHNRFPRLQNREK